ncbi:MAG: CDP-alcohol phosphatidyltransferase family protein [Candidatus Omnitrophica bacterium]|nr:CDP-alcohol phosphatidyltransferase family protein [Candidatus Omnitrophota bacterium]
MLNLPNVLTCSRFFLAILFTFFLFFQKGIWNTTAFLLFVLASLTDYWDGRIAREKNEVTSFGRFMDPLADKMLTLSAFAAFAVMRLVPWWAVGAVVARDLAVTVFRLGLPSQAAALGARSSGKNKTIFQVSFILIVLLYLVLAKTSFWRPEWTALARRGIEWGMMAVVFVTLWSGVRYLWMNRK